MINAITRLTIRLLSKAIALLALGTFFAVALSLE